MALVNIRFATHGPYEYDDDDQTLDSVLRKEEILQIVTESNVPLGGIILWSGTVATIPSGWQLCNGTGGTPDLRSQFVVGAGSDYDPDDTGGENSVTLSVSQMPEHDHGSATGGGWSSVISSVNHSVATGTDHTVTEVTSFLDHHAHAISDQGGGSSHENRPPYYALAYIQRTS